MYDKTVGERIRLAAQKAGWEFPETAVEMCVQQALYGLIHEQIVLGYVGLKVKREDAPYMPHREVRVTLITLENEYQDISVNGDPELTEEELVEASILNKAW